jgi:hypothetical protein
VPQKKEESDRQAEQKDLKRQLIFAFSRRRREALRTKLLGHPVVHDLSIQQIRA